MRFQLGKIVAPLVCASTILLGANVIAGPAGVKEEFSTQNKPIVILASAAEAGTTKRSAATQPSSHPSNSESNSGPPADQKPTFWGPKQPIKWRVDWSPTADDDLEQRILVAGSDQRERKFFVNHVRTREETDTSFGARLFPLGDSWEFKFAGEDINPVKGEDAVSGLVEVTSRGFLNGKYLKLRVGGDHFKDGNGSTSSAYTYGNYGIDKRLKVLGTAAVLDTHDSKTGDIATSKNLNLGGILTLPGNNYALGGLGWGSENPPLTKIFGISKAANDHGKTPFDHLAYLAQFRVNSETTFMLFGLMYGDHNQFVPEAAKGEMEGLDYSSILNSKLSGRRNSKLSRLRRFDSVTNASNDYEIAPFTLFGVYLKQDLGGMTLTTHDWEGFYNLWERRTDWRTARVFIGDEVSVTLLEGPPVGRIKEMANKISAGVQLPWGEKSVGAMGTVNVRSDKGPAYGLTLRLEWQGGKTHTTQ